jgi:SAM-dependent methyltransferase
MSEAYVKRVDEQVQQFANTEALWKLPAIYSYWNHKFIVPRLKDLAGTGSIHNVYLEALIAAARRNEGKRTVLYSVGAGDCTVETGLATKLQARGVTNACIVCLELSPGRLERARRNAAAQSVAHLMEFAETDLNTWSAPETVDVFIAHHSLHHLVELERIFDAMKAAMNEDSIFLTSDIIGRNGHQRWPETLHWIQHLWRIMPSRYRHNFQFNAVHDKYIDWNCAVSGFEGIRAQDVLPALTTRFGYDWFLGYGGIIDPFIERGYGHNFDPGNDYDTAFIDFVQDLNDTLLRTGEIRPTMMAAAFRKGDGTARHWSSLTVRQAVRPV